MLARLDRLPRDDIATSIVTFQEQAQGALAYLNRAKKSERVLHAYVQLERIWRWFLKLNVASFTSDAQAQFTVLKRQCPRLSTMDLRIAAIAIATGSTLLSRNLRDFERVPGLTVEDWTAE